MALTESVLFNIAAALVIGLLIGVERERRTLRQASRGPAGIRTYAITSLAGAASMLVGGLLMLAVTTAGVIVLTALGYWRARDDGPGLTSEIALINTVLLGGLAMNKPHLAGALAVIITVLLASRSSLHRFTNELITEQELHHALFFAVATVIILPLIPPEPFGPYDALNGRMLWMIVIVVMSISAAGHVAVRILGRRRGLPLAGFASGFVSSTATIGAMGARASQDPATLPAAVAGAVLSTVATIVQLVLVLAITDLQSLQALTLPLLFAGIAAFVYAVVFMRSALQMSEPSGEPTGAPFSIKSAAIFAITLAAIILIAAALRERYGQSGAILAATLGGLADTHAATISIAALASAGKLSAGETVLPVLAAFSANTVSKIVVASISGTRAYIIRVVPGLLLVAVAAWSAAAFSLS